LDSINSVAHFGLQGFRHSGRVILPPSSVMSDVVCERHLGLYGKVMRLECFLFPHSLLTGVRIFLTPKVFTQHSDNRVRCDAADTRKRYCTIEAPGGGTVG